MFQVASNTSTTTRKKKKSLNVKNVTCNGDKNASHLDGAGEYDDNHNNDENDQDYDAVDEMKAMLKQKR